MGTRGPGGRQGRDFVVVGKRVQGDFAVSSRGIGGGIVVNDMARVSRREEERRKGDVVLASRLLTIFLRG